MAPAPPPSGGEPTPTPTPYWALPPPTLPCLFVEPARLATLLASSGASPADAALLVRVGELGRALDTATAVARAQWEGWCGLQVRSCGARARRAGGDAKHKASKCKKKTAHRTFRGGPSLTLFLSSLALSSQPATPPPCPHPPPPPSTPR